jgi:hypothetical protein
MSERDIASKVALSPIPYSVAKASLEDVLLYLPRNRKLVPENDIRYQFLSDLFSLVPLSVRAMRKIIG